MTSSLLIPIRQIRFPKYKIERGIFLKVVSRNLNLDTSLKTVGGVVCIMITVPIGEKLPSKKKIISSCPVIIF
jgi:hypothetical protein